MSNIADKVGNIDTSHDGVLSVKRDLRTESAWIMFMRLASAGGAITPTGIRIMVSYLDQTGLEHTLEKLRNQMYPVGSLYFSTNSTSPATIYGGTWERYGKGRTLVSVDESDTDFTAGKTGGEKTHVHPMPNLFAHLSMGGTTIRSETISLNSSTVWRDSVYTSTNVYASSNVHSDGIRVSRPVNDTNNISASSLQPYISVYVWRRTA